jgi:hypothetical protein
MSKLAIVATTLLAVFGGGPPAFAEDAISGPRCVCGLSSSSTDVLRLGRPIISELANAAANERDSAIDGDAPTPQTLSRHHRRSAAARSTAYVVITRARMPWS